MESFFLFDPRNLNQILCVLMICLPVFNYGNCLGWMSPMSLLLQSEDSPRDEPLTDVEISWMASVPYLAGIPFYYILAYMGDKYGRKICLLFTSALGCTIWILKLFSTEFWAFIIARCMVGVLMAGSFVTCPVYIKEISESRIRGQLGCWTSVFYTGGSLFLYIIGDMLSYRTILLVCLSVPVVSFLLFLSMPESPSYLIQIGKMEDAEKVLLWLRRKTEVDDAIKQEIEAIKTEQKNDDVMNDENLIRTIFTHKILFRAFQIALMATLARDACGAIPVSNFAGDIFLKASEGTKILLNPNQQAMVLGAVQCFASIIASNVVEKSGRRPLLVITCVVSGISMYTLASWFLLKQYDIHAPSWIPIITLCICIFCDSAGTLPLGTVLIGEIFSFKYRGTVLAITMGMASVLDFFQVFFFKILAAAIGVQVAFYVFGSFCIFMAIYIYIVVPETKSRPLEDIYEDLKTKKEKKEFELQKEVISRC